MDRSIHPEVIGEEASMRDSKDTDGISIQDPGAERRRRSIAIAYCAVAWLSAALIYGFTFREAQSFFEVNLGRLGDSTLPHGILPGCDGRGMAFSVFPSAAASPLGACGMDDMVFRVGSCYSSR